MDPHALLAELVRLPGPPGQEDAVREAVATHMRDLGYGPRTDARGNVSVGDPSPRVVLTAHLDEIALIVRQVEADGKLVVAPLGGLHPWKVGELPVLALGREPVPGVLSVGSIHTEDPGAATFQARSGPLTWPMTRVITGLNAEELRQRGVTPGTRVVIAPDLRGPVALGDLVAGRFFDDRADLVSLLLVLAGLGNLTGLALVATASEETGGDGAAYYLSGCRPEVVIALEISPNVPDAPVQISPTPAVWVNDGYAAIQAPDLDLMRRLEPGIQYQALSRGGSDASIAASRGQCARPFTLGIPVENSHGFEIMHRDAPTELARVTLALLAELGIR